MVKRLKIFIAIMLLFNFIYLVNYLVNKEIDHRASQELILAIHDRDKQRIELLADKIRNINSANAYEFQRILEYPILTPLLEACILADYETAELLIEKGASVNYIEGTDISPIILITRNYSMTIGGTKAGYKLLKLLLDNGADPNFSERGDSPIEHICNGYNPPPRDPVREEEYLKAIKLLVEYGAEVTNSVLFSLANDNNVICMEYMLDNHGLDINAQTIVGNTALIIACKNENRVVDDMVALLLSKGADVSIKNEEGKTAYDYAIDYGNTSYYDQLKTE